MRTKTLLLSLSLFGCGGGGGGGESPAPTPPQPVAQPNPPSSSLPPPTVSHEGVWAGTMSYRDQNHSTLCRIPTAGSSQRRLVCMLFSGRDMAAVLLGGDGSVDVSPPGRWTASGSVHDTTGVTKAFALTDGSSLSGQTLRLHFLVDGVVLPFVGQPATAPPGTMNGVYRDAYMRGTVSLVLHSDGTASGQGGGCGFSGTIKYADTPAAPSNGLVTALDMTNCGGRPGVIQHGVGIVTGSIVVPQTMATFMIAFAVFDGDRWEGGHAAR